MTLAKTPNPKLEGSHDCKAVLTFPTHELDVIVSFDVDGYRDVCVQSVHPDFGRDGWGADLYGSLTREQIEELAEQAVNSPSWDRKRDLRDVSNYAPRAGGL